MSLSEGITNLNYKMLIISNNNIYPSNYIEEQWVCNFINDSKFILIKCKKGFEEMYPS